MRIKEIDIDGFGVWNGLKLQDVSEHATVIYGPNEAGKTTLMQFVRAVLYGFTPLRRSRYLPPVNGGRPGGQLIVGDERGEFVLSRYTSVGDAPENLGHVSVVDSHGVPRDPSQLDQLLASVDEPTFSNVFALGLREIQELGSLDDTSAADHLYKLTTGLDRVSLIDVMRELGQSRQRLLTEDDATSRIPQLIHRREKLHAEIDELSSGSRKWAELAAQRCTLAREADELQKSIDANLAFSRQIEAALEVQGPWNARAEAEKQLAVLGNPKEIPEEAVERLEDVCKQIAKLRRRMKKIAAHRSAMAQEAKAIEVNRALIAQAPRIEALNEHGQWLGTLQTNLVKLRDEIRKLDGEIELQAGGVKQAAGPAMSLDELPRDTVAVLRRPMQLLKEETEKLEKAKDEAEAAKVEAEAVIDQFESTIKSRRITDLSKAIQESGQRVALLRKRVQLEERLDQLNRRLEELDFDNSEISAFEETPMRVTALIGAVFSIGVMLFLVGVFGPSLGIHQDMSFLWVVGVAVSLCSFGGKLMVDRRAQDDVSENRRHLEQARNQFAAAKQERDQLDIELGPGSGALDIRLREAETELRDLEKLLPAKNEHEAAVQRNNLADRRLNAATEALKEARSRWRNALRSVGLPEDFAPHRVKQVVRSNENVLELRRRRDSRREELDQRERELLVLSTRIGQLLTDVRMQPTSDNPQAQLRQLTQALTQEKELQDLKQGYVKKFRKLQTLRTRTTAKIRSLSHKRRKMLDLADVADLKAFRQAAADWSAAQNLRRQRDELSTRIANLVGGEYTDEELSAVYAQEGSDLQSRCQQRTQWTREVQMRMAEIHERRGTYMSEMKALAADRRLAYAMLELATVEQELQESARRWQVLGVISRVLDTVRKAYETNRQPETLREASQYLARLTSGQYLRVWMPLDRRELLAEDNKGQSLSLEVLSRGTREAVYISLRLALASSFARRGAKLPLVLDDVLVNFDAGRVRCAAEVFHDFAKAGHQIIMFTCHEHISRLFEEAQVQVRTLPTRGNMVVQPKKRKAKKSELPVVEPVVDLVMEPVTELPPPPPPPVFPDSPPVPLRCVTEANALFCQVAQEETWFDPTNAYELCKSVRATTVSNLPESWPIAAAPPQRVAPPVVRDSRAQPYQVISFRYLPDSWPLAELPASSLPESVEKPVRLAPSKAKEKTKAIAEEPAAIPAEPVVSVAELREESRPRRFTWEEPEMWEASK